MEIIPEIRDIRRSGGAALDLANVAAGRIDAYYESGLGYWDIAAGTVIVKEAGGLVGNVSRKSGDSKFVLAASKNLYTSLEKLLKRAEEDCVGQKRTCL